MTVQKHPDPYSELLLIVYICKLARRSVIKHLYLFSGRWLLPIEKLFSIDFYGKINPDCWIWRIHWNGCPFFDLQVFSTQLHFSFPLGHACRKHTWLFTHWHYLRHFRKRWFFESWSPTVPYCWYLRRFYNLLYIFKRCFSITSTGGMDSFRILCVV